MNLLNNTAKALTLALGISGCAAITQTPAITLSIANTRRAITTATLIEDPPAETNVTISPLSATPAREPIQTTVSTPRTEPIVQARCYNPTQQLINPFAATAPNTAPTRVDELDRVCWQMFRHRDVQRVIAGQLWPSHRAAVPETLELSVRGAISNFLYAIENDLLIRDPDTLTSAREDRGTVRFLGTQLTTLFRLRSRAAKRAARILYSQIIATTRDYHNTQGIITVQIN